MDAPSKNDPAFDKNAAQTQFVAPGGIVAHGSEASGIVGEINFSEVKKSPQKKSESETKALVELAKSIGTHLKLLNQGEYCGSW